VTTETQSPASPRHPPAQDVTVQLVGRVANLTLGIFVTILVVRTLGDDGFGEWATLLAVTTLAGALCDLGFTQVAVRNSATDRAREPEWLGALIQLKFTLSLAALGTSIVTVLLIATSSEMRVAGLVLSLTLLLAAPDALRSIFQLRVRNDLFILVMSVQSVLWALVAVGAFLYDLGLVALAIGFAVSLVTASALQALLALRLGSVRLRGTRHRWRELLRIGVPVALGSVLILAYGRIDQLLVLVLAGASDAGLYGSAYRIFDQSQFVAMSVTTTVFPLLAASFAVDPDRFRALLQATVDSLIAVAIGGLAFVLVYAEQFVVLLFGSEFEEAAQALPLLIAAMVPVSLGYVLGMLVIVTGTQRRFLIVACAGLAFNVALNLALIPIWGFVAAAAVTLLTEVLVVSLTWPIVRPRLGVHLDLERIWRIAIAAGVTVALLSVLRALSMPVGVALVVTLVAYPASMLALRAVTIADLRTVWKTAERTI
jgi:O-antigen/teichoic acid export membrane protein